MTAPSPYDCPCGAPRVIEPCDKDEGGWLEACVRGCTPLRMRQPIDDLAREEVRDLVAEVVEMDRKGEL